MKRFEFRKALPNPILESGSHHAIALFSREVVRYIRVKHRTKHPNLTVHHKCFYDTSAQVHYLRIDWYIDSNIREAREIIWINDLHLKPLFKNNLFKRRRRFSYA